MKDRRWYTLSMSSHNPGAGQSSHQGAREYGYTVIYQQIPEGGFNVVVPAIPEICTFGETLAEARRMAQDALRCFLESALETGERIPEGS